VVPVVVSLDYVGSASQGVRNVGRVAWGVAMGLLVLRGVPTAVLSGALGGFVIAYAFYQLLPLPPLRGSRVSAISCGLMGRLVGTPFGTGGPFYAIYFNLRLSRSWSGG
jgi:uncharacterized membrane protein YfcA